MKKISLAIADDDEVLRIALTKLFQTQKDIKLLFVADNGVELLHQLETTQPDIILMDIRMPHLDGVEATKKVLERYPSIKIIAHTNYDLPKNIIEMHRLGVKGFISKSSDTEELVNAIRTVHTTGYYLTDETFFVLKDYIRKRSNVKARVK